MRINSTTTRMLIIAAIGLAVSACAVGAMMYTVNRTGAALTEMTQVFADEEAHEQEYLALTEALADTSDERERVRSYVLHGDAETVRFLSELDGLASDVGVVLETEKLEVRETANGTYDELVITLVLQGSERAVVQLLALLEVLPYHSYISQVDFVRDTPGAGQVRGTVALAVTFIESDSN